MSAPARIGPVDFAYGVDLGKWRALRSLMAGHTPRGAGAFDGLTKHIVGALAEVAVARFLGAPLPTGIGTFHREPDVLPDVEVRWRSREEYDLPIRDDDMLDGRFILVTGDPPTFRIHGWIHGRECLPQWRKNPGGFGEAWFVPRSELHPMTEWEAQP